MAAVSDTCAGVDDSAPFTRSDIRELPRAPFRYIGDLSRPERGLSCPLPPGTAGEQHDKLAYIRTCAEIAYPVSFINHHQQTLVLTVKPLSQW